MQTCACSTVHLNEDHCLPIVTSGSSAAGPTSATLVMPTPTPGASTAPWS